MLLWVVKRVATWIHIYIFIYKVWDQIHKQPENGASFVAYVTNITMRNGVKQVHVYYIHGNI